MFLDVPAIASPFLTPEQVDKTFAWAPTKIEPEKTPADYALLDSIAKKEITKIKKAISDGAEPDRARALHYGVANQCGSDIIVLLIELGGSINLSDSKGNTPLHIAANGSHVVCAIFLIIVG